MIKENENIAINITNVSKEYRIGQFGYGTLYQDLQSWIAGVRGKEDPNSKIGRNKRLEGTSFLALNNVSLTINNGEAIGIIGANGAGKSTLLKLISQVTGPTSGRIELNGRVSSMLEVGTGFNGEMTGRENVYLNGTILGMTRKEIDSKLPDIIEFSEIGDFIDTPVKRYSSGMYVKLAFSVAAHLDSEIIIMDEVLAVGDVAFQKKCLDRMSSAVATEGRTILYVSHNMDTIRRLCDRCIVLDEGRIVFDGDVNEAISIYAGLNSALRSNTIFDDSYHTYFKSVDSFRIKELFTPNGEIPSYESGEKATFCLKCSSTKRWEDIRFRLEIWDRCGRKIGSIITDSSTTYDAEEKEIEISFDTSPFVPGTYRCDIVAFRINEYKSSHYVDGVYPGFIFEIKQVVNDVTPLVWANEAWGPLHIGNAQMSVVTPRDIIGENDC